MDLSNIYAVTGKGGLFKLLARSKNGVVMESLVDGQKSMIFANQKISCLKDIAVYINEGSITLIEVLRKIYEKEKGSQVDIDLKDNSKLLTYFEELLPEYDREKVYLSDIRKIISWYNLLVSKSMIDLEEEKVEESIDEKSQETLVKSTSELKEDRKEKEELEIQETKVEASSKETLEELETSKKEDTSETQKKTRKTSSKKKTSKEKEEVKKVEEKETDTKEQVATTKKTKSKKDKKKTEE